MKTLPCLFIVLLMLLGASCGGSSEEVTEDPEARVQVDDFHFARLPGGARIVTGKLRNRSSEPIRNAQIQISLYDADNLLVTTMSVIVRDVEPGEQKAFREPVDAEDTVQGARVRSVLVL